MIVVFGHTIRVYSNAGASLGLLLESGPYMHPGGVHADEKRLFGLMGTVDEVQSFSKKLPVGGFHTFSGHGAGILYPSVGL